MTRLTRSLPPLKGVPPRAPTTDWNGVPAGWSVLGGEVEFPLVVLKEDALRANVALVADYCRRHGVDLAPHGKTTLSPELFEMQLAAGAWAITLANTWQCRVARTFGVSRMLIANEVVDPAGLRWLFEELRSDPGFEVYLFVDSLAAVEAIERIYAEEPGPAMKVLVELGYPGGRAGCRTLPEAMEVAKRSHWSPAVELAGVAAYEGLMPARAGETVEETISSFLREARELVNRIHLAYSADGGPEFIVTAGGSGYFDLVAVELAAERFDFPVRTVLRSGCYITHDAEMYEATSPLAGRSPLDATARLMPALELWATVLSRPESELAIVGFGKRDAAYDYRLPIPLRVYNPDSGATRPVHGRFHVAALNDQHAFVRIPPDDPLAVGNQLVSGISHPCGVFEKWRTIPIVDSSYVVTGSVTSYL